jgi:threonine dehydrogenase-like Zn-dependent dehydrogenase
MLDLGVTGPLPETISPEQAVFLGTTSIALQAVHDAHIKVGDHVVVFGLGVLGLLVVQLARLNGARWIDAVDPIESRRLLAQSFGASRTLDPEFTDIGLALKTDSPGADVAIEFSGSYAALHQAVRSVRMAGLVVAAGFYQGGGEALRLGEEWLHNRVSMVASLRGWANPHRDFPLWDRSRLREEALSLIDKGQLRVKELLTHKIAFERAQEAYELIDSGAPDVLKLAFEY